MQIFSIIKLEAADRTDFCVCFFSSARLLDLWTDIEIMAGCYQKPSHRDRRIRLGFSSYSISIGLLMMLMMIDK